MAAVITFCIIDPVIPRWAVPVTVITYDNTYRIQWGWQQSRAPQHPLEEPVDSFYDLLPSMDPWEWQLLFDLEIMGDEHALWVALTTQVCTIASDGSVIDGKGSFAWVISDAQDHILAECKGPVPGAKVTSFRAEGYGILSVLRFLIGMNKVHGQMEQDDESGHPQEEEAILLALSTSESECINSNSETRRGQGITSFGFYNITWYVIINRW